jgi:deazaflavin-dependent oxidoreductase (nitroreductase family)
VPLPARLARFNRSVTNRVTSLVAGWAPGFGIVTHRGRVSGRTYRTPVNAFRRPGGYAFALTYGRGDWVQNVLAAGGCDLRTRRRTHALTNPHVVTDTEHRLVPAPVRPILRLIDVDEVLIADTAGGRR